MPEITLDLPDNLIVDSVWDTFIKLATTTEGAAFNTSRSARVTIQARAVKTLLPGNMTFKLQGSLWSDIGSALTFSAADTTQYLTTLDSFRYMRFVAITAAGTDAANFWTLTAKLLQRIPREG